MASDTKDGSIEIALNNGYIFTNASTDDLLIRTTTSNQAIHIGIDKAAMTIRSNNVIVNQRLGIANNTPLVTLDISGTDSIKLPTGTTAQRPQAPFQGYVRYNTDINTFEGFGAGNAWGSLGGVKDTNQDTYISAESYPTSNDDALVFFNSNIERMRILKDGNVGIGTSNPLVSLHIAGTDSLRVPSGTTLQRPSSAAPGYVRYNTDNNTFEGFGLVWGSLGGVKDTNQDTYISAESYPTSNDDALVFFNSNIETMRLSKEGYLGIGTSNPQYRLDVNGSLNASSILVGGAALSANVGGGFTSSSNSTTYTLCNVSIGSSTQSNYQLNVSGDINFSGRLLKQGYEVIPSGPISTGSMVTAFQANPVSATYAITSLAASQSIFILSTQGTLLALPKNVHVVLNGTKLAYIDDINNDFSLEVTNPTPYTTQFKITLVSPASYGDVLDITIWPYIPDTNGVFLTSIDFASNIMFSNVGVGVSNPSYPLHVKNAGSSNWLLGLENGNVKTLFCHSGGMGMKLISSNVLSTTSMLECINDSNMLFYLNNEGTMGLGTSNISNTYKLQVEGAINASGSVTSSSDERLKKDIIKIKDSLSIVEQLNGYKFNFINDKLEKTHIGLIAQEVEKVIPEVVYEDNHGFKSVAYGNIVALLLEAIKEQQVMINELKGKIQ